MMKCLTMRPLICLGRSRSFLDERAPVDWTLAAARAASRSAAAAQLTNPAWVFINHLCHSEMILEWHHADLDQLKSKERKKEINKYISN